MNNEKWNMEIKEDSGTVSGACVPRDAAASASSLVHRWRLRRNWVGNLTIAQRAATPGMEAHGEA